MASRVKATGGLRLPHPYPNSTVPNTNNRLLDASTQERFYATITERYMAFCTVAGDSTSLLKSFASLHLTDQPPPTPTPRSSSSSSLSAPGPAPPPTSDDLSHILAALRKLREGIVASKRADLFATQAYLFAIRLGVLCAHPETYHPALLHLLGAMQHHHHHSRSSGSSLTALEQREAASYLVLDAACRRGDLAEAYRLRSAHGLRDAKVDAVLGALARDDWVAFFRARRGVDGHRARLLGFAEDGVRRHLLKAFGRAYLSVPLEFLEASAGLGWEEMRARYAVGWEVQGERVVIRKVQGRA